MSHARYGSVSKLRHSFDQEQRGRLMEHEEDVGLLNDSPRLGGRVESSKVLRRRRPLLLVASAALLLVLLLLSAGAYRNPASVESIAGTVESWRDRLGSLAKWEDPLHQAVAANISLASAETGTTAPVLDGPVIEPPAAPSEELHLFDEIKTADEAPAEAADSKDIIHAVAPPDAPGEAAEGELAGIQTGEAPAAISEHSPLSPAEESSKAASPLFQLQAAPEGFPAFMSSSKFIDTRPTARPPRQAASEERYISYNPHSGFHNQRIEFENAVVLASLLNRTLLAPMVRLGRPQGWMATPHLQNSLERDEKLRLTNCIPHLQQLEANETPGPCENYTGYTHVSWDTLADITPLEKSIRLVERTDISRSWFLSKDGLGLDKSDIVSFDDPSRYTIRFYETKADKEANGRYTRRLDIEELRDGPLASKRLLEFGSFFGSARLKIKPENRKLRHTANQQMVFRNALLTNTSNELVRRLGGRDAYIGLHLRVGDGAFKRTAKKNMQRVFRTLANDVFKLERRVATELLASAASARKGHHRQHARQTSEGASYSLLDDLDSSFFEMPAHEDFAIGKRDLDSSLKCRGQLHTDPRLLSLNRPVYIATDARSPRAHPDLAVFFHALPCAFVLGDFASVPGLRALEEVRSLQEGVRMAPFLFPFLEAMMAARSRIATIGTPGSTFSGFAAGTLHRVYAQEH